jgi:hypothetical protein
MLGAVTGKSENELWNDLEGGDDSVENSSRASDEWVSKVGVAYPLHT